MAVHEQPSTSEPALPDGEFEWHKIMEVDGLPEAQRERIAWQKGRARRAQTDFQVGIG